MNASKITPLMVLILTATFAVAQLPIGTFQHVIIIVQENRSVDNLFGGVNYDSNLTLPAGVNVAATGNFKQIKSIALTPVAINGDFDPDHNNKSFVNMYDGGAMDGAPDQVFCQQGASDCCHNNASHCQINNALAAATGPTQSSSSPGTTGEAGTTTSRQAPCPEE